MNNLFFVVCIVAIGCTAGVLIEYLKTRRSTATTDADTNEMLQQIEILEDRVRVLERIVTEKKFDLKSEIDKL